MLLNRLSRLSTPNEGHQPKVRVSATFREGTQKILTTDFDVLDYVGRKNSIKICTHAREAMAASVTLLRQIAAPDTFTGVVRGVKVP
jgi:hypothetical protein